MIMEKKHITRTKVLMKMSEILRKGKNGSSQIKTANYFKTRLIINLSALKHSPLTKSFTTKSVNFFVWPEASKTLEWVIIEDSSSRQFSFERKHFRHSEIIFCFSFFEIFTGSGNKNQSFIKLFLMIFVSYVSIIRYNLYL